jgi:hypothetical protein
MFHKMAPKIFDPSIFSMFQMDGVGFREIQLRKRKDRVLQTLVISSGMSLFGLGVKYAIKSLSKATGLKDVVVGSGMFGTLVLVGLVKNMIAKATKRKESS